MINLEETKIVLQKKFEEISMAANQSLKNIEIEKNNIRSYEADLNVIKGRMIQIDEIIAQGNM